MTFYVISRQTTTNGTATNVVSVTGNDSAEALLNAKIKAYRTMETFKNEATMQSAFVGISDLVNDMFYLSENWSRAE